MSHIDLLLPTYLRLWVLHFQFILLFLQVPRLKQTFSPGLQSGRDHCLSAARTPPATNRVPRAARNFPLAGRNFPQSHCPDIEKSALFAEAHSLQSSIREMKDD
jgi:hypothetical protein